MTPDQRFLLQQLTFILTDCDFTGRDLGSSNLAMALLDDIESIVQFGHDATRTCERCGCHSHSVSERSQWCPDENHHEPLGLLCSTCANWFLDREEREASGEPFDPRYDGPYAGDFNSMMHDPNLNLIHDAEQQNIRDMMAEDDDIPF